MGKIRLYEPAYGVGGGDTYGESLSESVSLSDTVATRVNGVDDQNDIFSQENSLPGGGWTTVLDLTWPSPRVIPEQINYPDNDGSDLINYGTDWYPNGKERSLYALTTSSTEITLGAPYGGAAPDDTTATAAANAGDLFLYMASTARWDQGMKLTIAGHANPYWVSVVYSDRIRLSRGLEASVANGAAITFRSHFETGDQYLVFDGTTWDSTPYYDVITITKTSERTFTFTPALSEGRSAGCRIGRDYRGLADIVEDTTYPGSNKNVLRQRLPVRFHGGYYPSKVSKYGSVPKANGKLSWADEQGPLGYFYIAGMLKTTANFNHGKNVGTKWLYVGTSNLNSMFIDTQLASAASSGQNQIVIKTSPYPYDEYATRFKVGGKLRLGSTSGELVTIQSVSLPNITLTSNLVSSYGADAQVYRAGNIAHIIPAFDGGQGNPNNEATTAMFPAITPQFNPDTFNNVTGPAYTLGDSYQMPKDASWGKYEALVEPGTPGSYNWRIRQWINGLLVSDSSTKLWILTDQYPDVNVLEFLPVFGGGLNGVPFDEEFRTGRVLVKVK